jgi:ubiquinone/menaquinone biosynthesis C-methylase UbiE
VNPLRLAYRNLLRFGFRLLYHEMAWSYDSVSWTVSLGQWRTWQRAALPYLHGPRVLEIACGTGDLLLDLRAAGFSVYGADISPYMVRMASRKLRRAGAFVPIGRASAGALPFTAGTFDSVVSTFPTPFIHQPNVLAEIARVLRPGGRLVVVDRASLLRPALLARLVEWLYLVTGQRADVHLSQTGWLTDLGWNAWEQDVPLGTSVVHLLVAERRTELSASLEFVFGV